MSMTPNQSPAGHTKPKQSPEPWDASGEYVVDANHNTVHLYSHKERIAACVNALASIPDPDAAIRQAREALETSIPLLETLHSLMSAKDTRASVYRRIVKARAALAALTETKGEVTP